MIQRGREERLDAVARTYLQAETPRSRLVVVAGEDHESTAAASQAVQHAAATLGVPTVLLHRGTETVDLELAHDRVPPLVVYHHGRVREAQLDHLRPSNGSENTPDLLLWDLPRRDRLGLRSMYLLGLWTWAFSPRQVRCLLPPADDGDPPLGVLRERMAEGVEPAIDGVRPEVLQRPDGWNQPGSRTLLTQVLQSMLSGSRRPAVRGPHPNGSRRVGSWGWAVALLLSIAALAPGVVSAQEEPMPVELVTIEIIGVDLDDPRTFRAPDGARLSTGPNHFLRLEPGVGTRIEGGVAVTSERADLFAHEGSQPLDWTQRESTVSGGLVLDSPEFTLHARQGRYTIGPSVLVIALDVDRSVLPGREGMVLTGLLLVMIALMFWRAAATRRKLDQPYESVRRRRR